WHRAIQTRGESVALPHRDEAAAAQASSVRGVGASGSPTRAQSDLPVRERRARPPSTAILRASPIFGPSQAARRSRYSVRSRGRPVGYYRHLRLLRIAEAPALGAAPAPDGTVPHRASSRVA